MYPVEFSCKHVYIRYFLQKCIIFYPLGPTDKLNSNNKQGFYSNTNYNIHFYADDPILYAASKSYKYLEIWLYSSLTFKPHMAQNMKIKMGSLSRNYICFPLEDRKTIVQSTIVSVFDYGDILSSHDAYSTLNQLYAGYCIIE